jgi:hypothetical protein
MNTSGGGVNGIAMRGDAVCRTITTGETVTGSVIRTVYPLVATKQQPFSVQVPFGASSGPSSIQHRSKNDTPTLSRAQHIVAGNHQTSSKQATNVFKCRTGKRCSKPKSNSTSEFVATRRHIVCVPYWQSAGLFECSQPNS